MSMSETIGCYCMSMAVNHCCERLHARGWTRRDIADSFDMVSSLLDAALLEATGVGLRIAAATIAGGNGPLAAAAAAMPALALADEAAAVMLALGKPKKRVFSGKNAAFKKSEKNLFRGLTRSADKAIIT